MKLAIALITCVLAGTAYADGACPDQEMATVATCGDDTCSCSTPCTDEYDCYNSGCCVQGYCAPACVCAGSGTLTLGCADPAPDPKSDCSAGGPAGWLPGLLFAVLLCTRRRR
jgi:hypothetical protein